VGKNPPLQDFDSSVAAEPRHKFHPPSRKGYGAAGEPGRIEPIDSIVKRFVTTRVIRV